MNCSNLTHCFKFLTLKTIRSRKKQRDQSLSWTCSLQQLHIPGNTSFLSFQLYMLAWSGNESVTLSAFLLFTLLFELFVIYSIKPDVVMIPEFLLSQYKPLHFRQSNQYIQFSDCSIQLSSLLDSSNYCIHCTQFNNHRSDIILRSLTQGSFLPINRHSRC